MKTRALISLLPIALAACGGEAPDGVARSFADADSIVRAWVEDERVPGAVLRVTVRGGEAFERAYGHAQLEPPRRMTPETVFDLASVTKVMATTMGLMLLVDRGQIELEAPANRYLPDFRGQEKDEITVVHLLTHRAGLSQWQPLYYTASHPDSAYAFVRDFELEWPVGEERHYSDLGFMLLGRVVESVSGSTLDAFSSTELYAPLDLTHTRFRPTAEQGPFAATSHGNPFERRMVHDTAFGYRIDVDPTSWDGWRSGTLVGEVNDGNAHHAWQGVAGHAGLFSNARELDRLLRLLLSEGERGGRRYISAEVVRDFLTPRTGGQALGWQRPEWAPADAFMHTGFTGTFVMGVPSLGMSIVLLTNRQNGGVDDDTRYPDVGPLQRAVVEALTR